MFTSSNRGRLAAFFLKKDNQMRKRITVWLPLFLFLAFCPVAFAQGTVQTPNTEKQTAPPSAKGTQDKSAKSTQDKNVQEYIELLRSDIRQQKAQIMGGVLELDVDEAAKFWPIYSEYEAESTKLNNLRLANIQEFARNYDQMTDAKADELIQNALEYRKRRAELLAKYYGRVKASLGSVQAARFLQIEDQMLMIIDLQITSTLPLVKQGL